MNAAFGDGGAVVMLLLWVYYSAQIFFLGVSFTGVWAERRGGGIRPVHGARRVPPSAT
jgi:membrane protein